MLSLTLSLPHENSKVPSSKTDLSSLKFISQFSQYCFCVESFLVSNLNQLQDKNITINTKLMRSIELWHDSTYHNTIKTM